VTDTRLPDTFSDEDRGTWKLLMESFHARLRQYGCAQATAGFDALELSENIESMSAVNERLYDLSGWRMQAVEGLLSGPHFYKMLRDKCFPTAPVMRKRSELEFAAFPDLFHDVAGHLPILVDTAYGDFLSGFAEIALRHLGSEPVMKAFARFYWFTAETGLVWEGGEEKILGAAVLTSGAEAANAMRQGPHRTPLAPAEIFATDYDIFGLQQKYFVAPSYDGLLGLLDDLEDGARSLRAVHV
jgi:phenylalanine-4-hydroxylase